MDTNENAKQIIEDDVTPHYTLFLFGGLSGIGATCFVQPLHLVKNRMQVKDSNAKPHNTFGIMQDVLRKEGVIGIYNGLSAGLLRQATYTSTRLGVYTWLINKTNGAQNTELNFTEKVGIGILAGICAAIVGTPTEIALVRMTLDGRLPESQKLNYRSGFHALLQISKLEGFTSLWNGVIPTICRSVIVNAIQLATYSQAKEVLRKNYHFEDNITCQITGSTISGLLTVLCSLPIDNAKTRIQQNVHNGNSDNSEQHAGVMDTWKKIIRKDGLCGLWRGFTPYLAKLGSHTVLTFLFLEQLTDIYKKKCT